jgi:hypothetical protein
LLPSFTVELDNLSHLPKAENQGAVGIDVGLTTHATLSTGQKVEGRKPHKTLFNRLKTLSRSLSRKVKGSNNRTKAKVKLAINLENYAVSHIAVSSTVTACGGQGAGRRRKTAVKPSPAKQEINLKPENVYT